MADWNWSIGPWRDGVSANPTLAQGGPQTNLGSATQRSLRLKLLDPSEASYTISGYSTRATMVEELITDLWVWRDGVPLYRGRTQPTTDTLDDTGRYDLTVTCTDYRGVLDRRLWWTDRTWTNIEQSTIVWDAITDAQTQPGGNLGLTQGTWPTTGIIRPLVTIKTGDTTWAGIKKLAAMQGGFDIDIDVDLHANLYYPRRGTDTGATLDFGGVVTSVRRAFDPARYANAIRQSGADSVAATTATTPDIDTAPEGRWAAQFSDIQLTTADMVSKTAATNLAQSSMLMPTYSLTLGKGKWGGPSHVWLGDYVTIPIRAGRLNERPVARVYEMDIDVDASNQETVTVVAGDVRMDARSVLRGIAKRLNVLAIR